MAHMPDVLTEGNRPPRFGNHGQEMTHLTGNMVLLQIPRCQLLCHRETRIAISPRFPAALVSPRQTMRNRKSQGIGHRTKPLIMLGSQIQFQENPVGLGANITAARSIQVCLIPRAFLCHIHCTFSKARIWSGKNIWGPVLGCRDGLDA